MREDYALLLMSAVEVVEQSCEWMTEDWNGWVECMDGVMGGVYGGMGGLL